jgi:VanZ like protein
MRSGARSLSPWRGGASAGLVANALVPTAMVDPFRVWNAPRDWPDQDSADSVIPAGAPGRDPSHTAGRDDGRRPWTEVRLPPTLTPLSTADASGAAARRARRRRTGGTALAVLGAASVLVATLRPATDLPGFALATPFLCLVCGDYGGADVAANLLLFLPLAIGLRLSGQSWGRTVLVCALLSLTVELLQLRVVAGRDASLSDLLTNTTSAAVGATLGGALPRMMAPRPREAAAFLAGGLALLLLFLAASAWLLAPWVPDGPLLSHWAHMTPSYDPFTGRVSSVYLDRAPMPANGPPADSAALRGRLAAGTFALEAELVSGGPVADRSWIYMLRAPSGRALTLTQLRREARIEVPARALRYRLWSASVSLPAGLPERAGVPVRLTASEIGGRVRLASVYSGRERSVELTISPAYGWIMILPFEVATGTGVRWITAIGLAAAWLPLGFWARRTSRPGGARAALAAALVLALAVIPAAGGFPPVHWSEWMAGALGAVGGWALRRPAAYLEERCASPSDIEFSSS